MSDAELIKKPKRFFGLTGNMWVYALGVMGINLAIGLVNSYQAEFFNKILNANLIAVAVIILVAKFVSIFADIIIGNLIDRAHFKSGKMRPWILMSAFPLAVFTMLSFVAIPFGNSTGGNVGKYIYITLILILWNVSMTMADIPSQGMLSLVSNNSNDTNNAAGMANTLKSLALAVSGLFITFMCVLTGSGDVTWREYLLTAGVMSAIGLGFQLFMYFKCKETVRSTSSSGMTFKEMFRELRHNKQIMIVLGTYLLGFARNIGMGIAVQASCILIRDGIDLSFIGMGVLRGDQCSWAIGITSAISSAIFIVLNPVINKKLGEKRYFILFGLYGFFVSFVSFLLYVFAGPAFRGIIAILIYQFFMGISFAPNGYLPMVMTADIVDYQEWKTGKRTEGTQFAILSMSNKLSNALSVSMGLLLIGAIGYSSDKYFGIVNAGGEVSTYVTNAMQNKAWAIYFLLPGICMLASSILMLFYKIDEKTKKQMREELAARHAQDELDAQADASDKTEPMDGEEGDNAENKSEAEHSEAADEAENGDSEAEGANSDGSEDNAEEANRVEESAREIACDANAAPNEAEGDAGAEQ